MKIQYLLLAFAFLILSNISAQNDNSKICNEGDCPPSLFSIQLDETLKPDNYSAERTDRFNQAFLSFQVVRSSYAYKEKWIEKRKESQLGGQSCLRHYQLEAQFSYEYIHNPKFKKFVDGKSTDAANFVKNGFDSSRKGLNLSRRMTTRCPKEVAESKTKKGPSLDELPKTYQKLGLELGYFDESGKLMRPLDPPSSEGKDISKMSKGKQVKALKELLALMPFENVVNDKINGVKNVLDGAKPNLDNLTGAVKNIDSGLGSLLPNISGLMSSANSTTDKLNDLKKALPDGSAPDLRSSIGNLFNLGKGLGSKASDLLDKSKNLKNKFDDLKNKSNDLQKEFNDKNSEIDKLLNDLKDVSKKKAELEAKLEDNPKKILDALRQEVPKALKEANEIVDQAVDASKVKNDLLEKIDDLLKEKDEIKDKLAELEEKKNAISEEFDNLEKKREEAEEAVKKVKEKIKKIDELKDKIENLKPESELQNAISDCESGLKNLLSSIVGLNEKKDKIKNKIGGLFSLPDQLANKLSDLKVLQNDLILPKNGVPVSGNILAKVDGLLKKSSALSSTVDSLTDNKTAIQKRVEGLSQNLDQVKVLYAEKAENVSKLKDELIKLMSEKADVKEKLSKKVDDLNGLTSTVTGFIDRFNIFGKKTDCNEGKELKDEVEKIEKELTETEPEIEKFEKDIENAETEQSELSEKTKEVENEKRRQIEKVEELKREEQLIKQEYGTEIKLEPVSVEEWSESFEVERPYWEAVFHPDDEVVEGQKGRYFEVKLKDADKNVKLLFDPGKYSMSKSDFRKKYGSTIGSFVTEALHAMKKSNQVKVKLYIQGSADIVGHETFSGSLEQQFLYESINVLPKKTDPEKFFKNLETKSVPKKNFRNKHLPDLRAQYLKEMIKVYSKKFDPVLLEGVVKDFKDEGERNAIIYLYIPEEILSN